ncbi:DUF4407 domain-containing protein [Sulfurovum sp. ST-21]|uniref:DUF4407 domain-containing protein n=1 Tax=Sulfurovum indicum TaxID=2779528 RepID=A0A7M1S174_9BACT|nr:DUF4407 domain-containing protein [Sulfurovum indicum]QOR61225.1 DUF4407 domain-containing protein [Sulfurovum indicum]
MKMINKIARDIAAIDNIMLNECPQKDKIWATQIGYALILTFVVLWGITFYSITIMNGGDVFFDAETKSVRFDSNIIETGEYVLYGVVSAIVALVVVLFDRAFYQSDWFMQMPYGAQISLWKKTGFWAGNILKITVRISISLFLAYTFSSFLELKFYESELLASMQKKHLKENKKAYDDMKTYAQKLEEEEDVLKQAEEKLIEKIKTLDSGVVVWSDDSVVRSLEEKKKSVEKEYEKMFAALDTEYHAKMKVVKEARNPLQQKLNAMQQEYDAVELKYQAEVGGLKEIEVGGKIIRASGIPTEGRRAKVYKKRMHQLKGKMRELSALLHNYDVKIQLLVEESAKNKEDLQVQNEHALAAIDAQLKEYKQKVQKGMQANAKTIMKRFEAQLKRVQKRLEDIAKNKQQYIEAHYKEIIHSPEFIPFRDGPMSRLIAMDEMKQDPKTGKEVGYFSWVVKGILIFLEIAPILAKMIFGPPTVYAAALQMQTKRATQRILENDGLSRDEIDELIAVEKKKMELEEAKKVLEQIRQERMSEERKTVFSQSQTKNYEEILKEVCTNRAA